MQHTVHGYPDKAIRVQVFEPAHPKGERPETIYDDFELAAGEDRDIEVPTGTTGYRYLEAVGNPYPVPSSPPKPRQKNLSPETVSEVEAGRQRGDEHRAYVERGREQARRHDEKLSREPVPEPMPPAEPDPEAERRARLNDPLHPMVRAGAGDELVPASTSTDKQLPPLPEGVARRGEPPPRPARKGLSGGTVDHGTVEAERQLTQRETAGENAKRPAKQSAQPANNEPANEPAGTPHFPDEPIGARHAEQELTQEEFDNLTEEEQQRELEAEQLEQEQREQEQRADKGRKSNHDQDQVETEQVTRSSKKKK